MPGPLSQSYEPTTQSVSIVFTKKRLLEVKIDVENSKIIAEVELVADDGYTKNKVFTFDAPATLITSIKTKFSNI